MVWYLFMAPEEILRGSTQMFLRYGFRSITMDDIAHHLGISKKTIYQHFKDKNDIILSMIKLRLEKNKSDLSRISAEADNAVKEMIGINEFICQMFSRVPPVVFYDLQKYFPESWKLFREFKEDFLRVLIKSNIEKGIEEGLFRDNINVDILSKIRIEEVELAMNPTAFPPNNYELTHLQMALMDMFLYGITTQKGREVILSSKG